MTGEQASRVCRLGLTLILRLPRSLLVLRCVLDRQYPALAPLYPDLILGLQLEGRLIQTSEPNLDERVTGTDWIKESRPTERAEATSAIA